MSAPPDIPQLARLVAEYLAEQQAQVEPLVLPNPAGHQVVAPGQTIGSEWGNAVWNQSMNRFASPADRDTQWPTPPNGAVCVTLDTGTPWFRYNGVWTSMVISARMAYFRGSFRIQGQNIVNGVPMNYPIIDDTHAAWDANGFFHAPSTGTYSIVAQSKCGSAGVGLGLQLLVNGAVAAATGGTAPVAFGSVLLSYARKLTKGDTVAIQSIATYAAQWDGGTSDTNFLTIVQTS